jgi:site-specific DNA-methyltransferase (adenine-specific)
MNLINGDCLEVLKTLPDKSVDLFICDLPYGCLSATPLVIPNTENKHRKACPPTPRVGCSWDIKLDLNAFWVQVKRLCKDDHTPVLMFCNTKFGYDLIKSNPDWFRYDLVWNKMRGVSFLSANKMPLKSHEMVYVFSKKGANYYRKDEVVEGAKEYIDKRQETRTGVYGTKKVLPHSSKEGVRCSQSVISNRTSYTKGGHPTEKPVELYKWLIERYSKEGDAVLDPTFGSGNSGRACADLKRSYVGIEKDEGFFNKYKPAI